MFLCPPQPRRRPPSPGTGGGGSAVAPGEIGVPPRTWEEVNRTTPPPLPVPRNPPSTEQANRERCCCCTAPAPGLLAALLDGAHREVAGLSGGLALQVALGALAAARQAPQA